MTTPPAADAVVPPSARPSRGLVLAAVAVLVAAVPPAVWWLWGQQDATGFPRDELDYFVRPPDLAPWVENVIGGVALGAAGAAALFLLWAGRRGRFGVRWWQVIGPLLVVGAVVGTTARVFTAGVIGANIGVGLAVLFGTPFVAALLVWAVARGVWLARHGGGARPPRLSRPPGGHDAWGWER